VEQLAGCIERLLEKPGLASQMGSNGYRFVEDHYGVEQHLAQLMAVLRRETGFLMKNPVS
jgi:glycosyltransferase involved in cell wall biosynthesis